MKKIRNKKFNLYCGMLIVAVLFGMGVSTYQSGRIFIAGAQSGWNSFMQGKEDSEHMEHFQRIVNVTGIEVFPKDVMLKTTDSIVNMKTGDKMPMVVLHGMVLPKNSQYHDLRQRILMGIGCAEILLGIVFWIVFIKLIISVNKGEIFEKRMEKRFAEGGWLVFGIYVLEWAATLTNHYFNLQEFEFEAYDQLILAMPQSALLYSAFGMLLIGQICKIGRLLKEEQELTI